MPYYPYDNLFHCCKILPLQALVMANNLCTKTVNMQPKPIKFLSKTEQSAAPESRVTAAEEEC